MQKFRMISSSIDSRRRRDLFERLRSLGVNVAAVEKADLTIEELSELVERLEKLVRESKES